MRQWWISLMSGILLAMVAVPVFAQGGRGDQAVIGKPLTIRSGEVQDGNLFVMAGRLTIERSGRVNGDIAVVGGDVVVGGEVQGDLAVFGGNVSLQASAVVNGDLLLMGGRLDQAPGAVVRGEVLENFNLRRSFGRIQEQVTPSVPAPTPFFQVRTPFDWVLGFVLWVLRASATSIVLAMLGVLAVMLLPQPIQAVTHTARTAPLPSLLVGLATMLVVPFALVILLVISTVLVLVCIGLLGFPLVAILALAWVVLLVFGWIAVGLLLGEQIFGFLGVRERLPLAAVIIGVVIITLLASIPWLGWLFIVVCGSLGLGAVLLSRFGTSSQTTGWPGQPSAPPTSPAPPPSWSAEPPATSLAAVTRGEWVPAAEEPPPPAPSTAEPGIAASSEAPGSWTPAEVPVPADDFQIISGIGPVYAQKLREAGIRTFEQLAQMTPAEIAEKVKGPGIIPASEEEVVGWLEEAKRITGQSDS